MDFLQLDVAKGGCQYVLVITDHFTRFAQAIPTRNMTAKTTADAFLNNFVRHYGLPMRIHSDQGANFESKLMKEVCEVTSIARSRTTPYHAMGNGMCERFNRTLIGMLGSLQGKDKADWTAHITPLVHAYNSTRHDTTGQSPFFLMFGREPRLPVDLAFGLNPKEDTSANTSKYAEDLRNRFRSSYDKARKTIQTSQDKQKKSYDYRIRGAHLHPGDRVLVKVMAFEGRHKLVDKWSEDVYTIVRQINDKVPVFEVQREDGHGKKRVLHRNLLLPIGSLNEEQDPVLLQPSVPPSPTPRKRRAGAFPSEPVPPTPAPRGGPSPTPRSSLISPPSRPVPAPRITPRIEDRSDDESDSDEDFVIPIPAACNGPSAIDDHVGSGEELDVLPEQPSDDSGSVQEAPDVLHGGDARASDVEEDEASGETEEEGSDSGTNVPEVATPEDRPRRSGRERRPPQWYTSGDFVMAQQPDSPDWRQRADFLRELTTAGHLPMDNSVRDALLSVILNR
ncbi:MAG: DDE-type integrase/transposase/recombinase, partial [Sedimenticola sp.]